jgi:rubrerythrin
MSKVTDSIKDSIANRKFSKVKVTKTCWNCGHTWKGNSRSFCPRCLGGRLELKDFKKV